MQYYHFNYLEQAVPTIPYFPTYRKSIHYSNALIFNYLHKLYQISAIFRSYPGEGMWRHVGVRWRQHGVIVVLAVHGAGSGGRVDKAAHCRRGSVPPSLKDHTFALLRTH